MAVRKREKNGTKIVVHCVSISASIDIYIKFRKLKNTLSYKVVLTLKRRTLLLLIQSFFFFFFENVLSSMMKRIKFNFSFISFLLLSIQHNICRLHQQIHGSSFNKKHDDLQNVYGKIRVDRKIKMKSSTRIRFGINSKIGLDENENLAPLQLQLGFSQYFYCLSMVEI